MHNEIGAVALGCLSAFFAAYGLRELAAAYRITASAAWCERAVPGAGGVVLGALFALMTMQVLV
ncbi:hypothetical protein [Rhodopila globiformis]|uniref:Uncharacterized protein n=1 Tax=Rhodopila globiformis TaxID=1071 RepID=A0A2S6NND5_RHOGL|nr:hypothetical protein [Rhodopila globiformis]PPQ38661.1 hypothetical protein CCS01_02110 [Rhodopila globiformis]